MAINHPEGTYETPTEQGESCRSAEFAGIIHRTGTMLNDAFRRNDTDPETVSNIATELRQAATELEAMRVSHEA